MKKILWISTLSLFMLLLVACNNNASNNKMHNESDSTNEGNDKAEQGDYTIDLSGKVIEEDDRFIFEGKSNLLPNARLIGELVVDDGETVLDETTTEVEEDGSFQMELDHHKYGDAELIVRFEFEDSKSQDEEIVDHYGEDGEELEGPFVYRYSSKDIKKAEVVIPYDAKKDNDLTIEAPNWEKRPEDYGDGRVWFEDVEVTEDGRYFYVSGKTNLVEGANLKIFYYGTNGKTRVLPDGTFEAKFDYEYHEGEEMTIEFEPRNHSDQWSHVQEAYGKEKDGEKLVGDLVERSDLSGGENKIIYPIDWSEEE